MNEFNSPEIKYLGWSGFHIHTPSGENIFIDPPKGTIFPKTELIIFITHGHPEHIGGTLNFLRDPSTDQKLTIISSKKISSYLREKCKKNNITFVNTHNYDQRVLSPYLSFKSFNWTHMPLLPPGILASLRHILKMIKGFRLAWKIIRKSLNGPLGSGGYLGYILDLKSGPNIIIYGEGLHRHSSLQDVINIGKISPGSTLFVAAEPEDVEILPDLIKASGACSAILYEPHRPWRDIFELPHINLNKLKEVIIETGVDARVAKIL